MTKKGLFAGIAVILLIFALAVYWIGGIIMEDSSSDSTAKKESVDYLLILGCRLDGKEPGKCLDKRIDEAVRFLRERPWTMAVCTGGQGEDEVISEAEAISRALQRRGIHKRRILLEDKSTSTYENFAFTKEILDKRKGETPYQIAFVTNDFHVYRARRMAQYVGFSDPIAVSGKVEAGLFYPNFAREIAAVINSWIRYR